TKTPLASRALAERLVAELAPDVDAARAFGISPLFKDWWTGELHAPSLAETASVSGGPADEDDESPSAPPRSSRLRRSPKVREANEHDDDDNDEPGMWMVQGDEPHQHAEDPMGMKRPADRDDEASAEELGDMVSDLPEA